MGIPGEEDGLGLGGLHADAAVMVTDSPRQVWLTHLRPQACSLSARDNQTDREAEHARTRTLSVALAPTSHYALFLNPGHRRDDNHRTSTHTSTRTALEADMGINSQESRGPFVYYRRGV